jgi:hypothetical protein
MKCNNLIMYFIGKVVAAYFEENWFNISDKWSYLGRRHLPTFGNNTTNRIERYILYNLHITKVGLKFKNIF